MANGAIAQQTFEAYAAYVLPQLHNILAHSNPRPFAGNLEGHKYGADEDMMTGDLLYPNPSYPTINSAQQPLYPTQYYDPTTRVFHPTPHGAYTTPQPYLPPLPGLGFSPHPHYPMANAMYPYPPAMPQPFSLPHQTKPAQDKETRSKENKATMRTQELYYYSSTVVQFVVQKKQMVICPG